MRVSQTINVPVLTYHSIDESGSVISTAPEIFRRQMKYLSDEGYCVVTLNRLTEALIDNQMPPDKAVVLTFDDGFQNFYTTAFPVLEEYGFRATVFLVTGFCGLSNNWAGNPPDFPLSPLLSWPEIKELHKAGIEFGSHTRMHSDLTKVPVPCIEREIVPSKQKIEDALGSPVTTFAYPFGKFNPQVKQVVAKEFKAACSTNLGKVHAGSDFFSLERVDTYYLSNPKMFRRLSSTAFDKYLRVRQAMRDVKAVVSRN